MAARHGSQLAGQFIIDAGGTVRWSFVEAFERPDQVGCWPSDEEMVATARRVLH